MNNKQESVISGVAALLLLLSAMINPLISAGLAVAFLVVVAVYKYLNSTKK